MSPVVASLPISAGIFSAFNFFERKNGPHYYQDPTFFKNMPKSVSVNGFVFHPIPYEFKGMALNLDSGAKLQLTGRVFGQGSASTVFEGKIISGPGKGDVVAVKIRDHSTRPVIEANEVAMREVGHLKGAQEAQMGRVKYYGKGEFRGMTATVTRPAQGMNWSGVNPHWINNTTFKELGRLFDQIEARGLRPGDFEITIDRRGRVYLIDVEGLNANHDLPYSRDRAFARLHDLRRRAGLKPIPQVTPPKGSVGPKQNIYGSAYRGFFVEAGVNGLIGFAGYGMSKLAEQMLGRKLSTAETIAVTTAPAAPVVAYSIAKNYGATRAAGSSVVRSVAKTGATLGKGLAGGLAAGIGASFLLGDLGLRGETHTIATLGLGIAGASHPAGIAFFAGYSFGKFLDWGSEKILGKSLSSGLADGIEYSVEGVKSIYKSLHPMHRRIARKRKAYEAAQERRFRDAVVAARKFKEEQRELRQSHKRLEAIASEQTQEGAAGVMTFIAQRNGELRQGKITMDEYSGLVAAVQKSKSAGTVAFLEMHEDGGVTYLIKIQEGPFRERVTITWRTGHEPFVEVLRPGSPGFSYSAL